MAPQRRASRAEATAARTASWISEDRSNRTSVFCGWTLTSTRERVDLDEAGSPPGRGPGPSALPYAAAIAWVRTRSWTRRPFTKTCWTSRLADASTGRPAKPLDDEPGRLQGERHHLLGERAPVDLSDALRSIGRGRRIDQRAVPS